MHVEVTKTSPGGAAVPCEHVRLLLCVVKEKRLEGWARLHSPRSVAGSPEDVSASF